MNSLAELIVECPQQSAEWFKARCGVVTASEVWKCADRTKKGERSAKGKEYLAQIVAERLTGSAAEHYVSYYMERGREFESFARAAYETQTGQLVGQVGFVKHPTLEAGASPDGLILDTSDVYDPKFTANGIEIKCCQNHIHLQNMGVLPGLELIEGVPADYVPQMDFCMACTGAEWWDFVSYHPDMPDHLQCYVKRLNRDEKRIAELEFAVVEFLAEVNEVLEKLKERA